LGEKIDLSHLKFEPLGEHDRAAFSCGSEALDSYIQKQASQDVKKKAAIVYVLTPDGKTILGFYTLSQYSIQLDVIPEALRKKFPKYPAISATLLGRLARHISTKGEGVGEHILMDALHRALKMSKQIASAAIVTDAKDQRAVDFYKRYGFIELPKIDRRLFVPMATIAQLFPEPKAESPEAVDST
jgi:predicted GNAT family N-acyltransferase